MPTIPVPQSLLGRPVFWAVVVAGLLALLGLTLFGPDPAALWWRRHVAPSPVSPAAPRT